MYLGYAGLTDAGRTPADLPNAAPEWQAVSLGRNRGAWVACPLQGLVRQFSNTNLHRQLFFGIIPAPNSVQGTLRQLAVESFYLLWLSNHLVCDKID